MEFLITALVVGGLCGVVAYKNTEESRFTKEDIGKTLELREIGEYNNYCKHVASKGVYSDKQVSFNEYFDLIKNGYVKSINSVGSYVLYNRKKNHEIILTSLTT